MQRRVKHPNAGIMAIEDLLRYPVKRIYVTGFSFYTTGYLPYPNYRPSYAKKAVRHHDQNQNKSYFCRLLARDPASRSIPWIDRLLGPIKSEKPVKGLGPSRCPHSRSTAQEGDCP